MQLSSIRRRWSVLLALVLSLSLIAAACGGGDDEPADGGIPDEGAGEPTPGGNVIYALEAENSNGWCLPEGQLAISGIQVARAVYDTLTVPNEEAEYVPFLAEAVEPNDDFTEWTITIREGVKFHDGTDLTAEVVKNNLDAYRGQYEGRSSLLFTFVLSNVADVVVTDPMTVTVTTTVPWPSFDVVPVQLGPTGHHGPGPAGRCRDLRHEHDRHRPLHEGGVEGQRQVRGHEEPRLLADRRRRQPAPLPRRDRVPTHRRG